MCSWDRDIQWAGSWEGIWIAPVIPPPPVTNKDTGSFEVLLAYAGVHTAIDRQSSAEDQAVEPWSSFSPMLTRRLGGSYTFQKLHVSGTYCGQAMWWLKLANLNVVVLCIAGWMFTWPVKSWVNPFVRPFWFLRGHPAKVPNWRLCIRTMVNEYANNSFD